MNEGFKKHYLEAIETAKNLYCGVKNEGYNAGGVDIRDYWAYGGVRDLAYMCHAKAKRLISLSSSGNTVNDCGVEDTCLDGINYFAFGYAESKMRAEERERLRDKNKTGFIASIKGTVPAVQASLSYADNAMVLGADGSYDPDAEHLKALASRVRELEIELHGLEFFAHKEGA